MIKGGGGSKWDRGEGFTTGTRRIDTPAERPCCPEECDGLRQSQGCILKSTTYSPPATLFSLSLFFSWRRTVTLGTLAVRLSPRLTPQLTPKWARDVGEVIYIALFQCLGLRRPSAVLKASFILPCMSSNSKAAVFCWPSEKWQVGQLTPSLSYTAHGLLLSPLILFHSPAPIVSLSSALHFLVPCCISGQSAMQLSRGDCWGLCRNTLNLVPAAWLPTCRSVAIDTRWHWQGLMRAVLRKGWDLLAAIWIKRGSYFFKRRAYLVCLDWAFQNYLIAAPKHCSLFYSKSLGEELSYCSGLFTTSCTTLKHPGGILMQQPFTGNTPPLALNI